ncbi:MAG: TIGR03905 family TSCPD domain-containing protein [Clostridiales bacterium]|nr:TIGR03905 family TSCPD domain-containing protein [Clostridiales bacterium]
MTYTYKPVGVCSQQIVIDVNDDETINNVQFTGGCHGNLQGIAALVKGKTLDEVISALKGIDCRMRGTSCPDQLAKALEQIKEEF